MPWSLRHTLFGALLCLFAATLRAQDVPCEKYTLPNGMTVILHEDHSLPIATVNIWYRVGSQDEPPGRSGFAHLFEHLMFMGTHRVPGNQFDILMETGGGANNASTDLHRTNYYSWGPAKLLPTLLWLDADRLENMGLDMTQEKLDKQRDVVRNELRQTVENAPYGKAGEAVYKLLYTPDHPYYYGIIGTHQDLEAATVSNVKDFFANFYVPSNASLVVAGDFDSGAVRPLIADLFGSIGAGQPITRKYARPKEPLPVRSEGVKRFTAIDRVELPRVEFSYHSPIAFGPGDAEMQLAASVLADGKSSRLYKRLVMDEKLAAEVSAAQMGYPLDGMFQVDVYALPGADLDRVEAVMDEEIGRFLREGPTDEELERYKAAIELGSLRALESIASKADRMNEYEYYWGEPNSFKRDLDRFRNATAKGVRDWAGEVLKPDSRVIVRVLPEEPETEPSARDERPSDAPAGTFTLPEPESYTLENGLKVLVWNRPSLPMVSLRLVSRANAAADPMGRQGLMSLGAEMMGEGAGEMDALEFENRVQSIGATFRAGADLESTSVSMTVLDRNLDQGARLFADAVLRPRFDDDAWQRVHSLKLEDLQQRAQSPAFAAGIVGERLLFGDANPYAWPADGLPSTVEPITLQEARAALLAGVRPDDSTLLIAGDISGRAARLLAEQAFGEWRAAPGVGGGATPGSASGVAPAPAKPLRVVLVDRPGSTQTSIRFTAPGIAYDNASRVKVQLLNVILGGSFTSRLNQNLREDKGYTYGARSRFRMLNGAGSFSAAASVQAEVTGASLKEFLREFDRIRAGDISEAEATKAAETLRNDTISGFEGLGGLLGAAEDRLVHGLGFATVGADLAEMQKVRAADLNALARTALPVDEGVLVLVGDKGVILPQLEGLGLPEPEMYDVSGVPVVSK
ncbi:MAG: insulinase family protein [Phycisphaerales bacterium]|nr:insulinase family protein [Phycisphaerales bacterium]